MRSQAVAQHFRRILCVFPRYTPSFGTFEHAYRLMGVKAFMPPQGILLIAAYLPEHWEVRFVDENIRAASDGELDWAGLYATRSSVGDAARASSAASGASEEVGAGTSVQAEVTANATRAPRRSE